MNEAEPTSRSAEVEHASDGPPQGLLAEFGQFLIQNKRWWLAPIIVFLLLIGILAFLSNRAAVAPFIYTIF